MDKALDFWDCDTSSRDIEELFVLVELLAAIPADDGCGPLLESVRNMISTVIERSLAGMQSSNYLAFVQRLFRDGGSSAAVSLNWDMLLDEAMTRSSLAIDYGCPEIGPLYGHSPSPGTPTVKLYKLHGSLNWLWCGFCKKVSYDPARKVAIQASNGGLRCSCNKTVTPMFTPPSSRKLSEDASMQMRKVWQCTHKFLEEAEALCIVGYSFPPTDNEFRMMLRHALKRNTTLSRVLVVTSPRMGSDRVAFEDHYLDVLGEVVGTRAIDFEYSGFGRWIANGFPGLPM